MIDSKGNPTTDPNDMKTEPPGAILPLGGVVAHKGTGLAIMVEVLGGALSGLGCASGSRTMISNGVLINIYNIEHFVDPDEYYDEIESLISHIKSSALAPGFDEILVPGEPEYRSAERVEKAGIEVDEKTWELICEEARHFGIDPDKWTGD